MFLPGSTGFLSFFYGPSLRRRRSGPEELPQDTRRVVPSFFKPCVGPLIPKTPSKKRHGMIWRLELSMLLVEMDMPSANPR